MFAAKARTRLCRPNVAEKKLESIVNRYFPGEFRLNVKNGVIVGGKVPDFVNVNGNKTVVELFGDYWHGRRVTGRSTKAEEDRRRRHFADWGFKTAIVWESELANKRLVRKKIKDVLARELEWLVSEGYVPSKRIVRRKKRKGAKRKKLIRSEAGKKRVADGIRKFHRKRRALGIPFSQHFKNWALRNKRISRAMKGRKPATVTLQRAVERHFKKISEPHRQRLSEYNRGRVFTAKQKKAVSDGLRASWARRKREQ